MHSNEEIVRSGYAAFAAGDLDTVRSMFADDISWHLGGTTSLAGDYEGIDAVFGFFGAMFEQTAGTFTIEVHDVVANDQHAVALVREQGQRTGKTLDVNQAHVWHLVDGKVKDFRALPYDFQATQDFWG